MSMVHQKTVDSQVLKIGGSIALVGQPNVGKSAIFQRLTGQRVIVSNYPGTTVEVARGTSRSLPGIEMVDTPGVIAFPPHSDDERVTEQFLISEPLNSILQVGDAKNHRRTLVLAVQLAEMGLPLVLALNMMDEAEALGLGYDYQRLSEFLGVPVVPTTAIHGLGIRELNDALASARISDLHIDYGNEIEEKIEQFKSIVETSALKQPQITSRSLALLWLGRDPIAETWLKDNLDQAAISQLEDQRQYLQEKLRESISTRIQHTRLAFVKEISDSSRCPSYPPSVMLTGNSLSRRSTKFREVIRKRRKENIHLRKFEMKNRLSIVHKKTENIIVERKRSFFPFFPSLHLSFFPFPFVNHAVFHSLCKSHCFKFLLLPVYMSQREIQY